MTQTGNKAMRGVIVVVGFVLLSGLRIPAGSGAMYGSAGVVGDARGDLVLTGHIRLAETGLLDRFRAMDVEVRQRQFEVWLPSQIGPVDGDDVHEFALITDEVREHFFETVPFGQLITEAAIRYEVDPALVVAVIRSESAFKTDASSIKGAQGLMQLMPETGEWMGASNLFDPAENIEAGVRYLKYLESQFDGDLVHQLAAYNAGEGIVRRYGGIPPYPETRTYVKRVLSNYEKTNRELIEFSRSLDADYSRGVTTETSLP